MDGYQHRAALWRQIASLLVCWVLAAGALAQLTDPLGNRLFLGRGEEIYNFSAAYEILGGESSVRREKKFREKSQGRNYFSFEIQRESLQHRLTVGNFHTKFSAFTLNKELFDAIQWQIAVPRRRGSIRAFLARMTNNTFTPDGRPIEGQTIRSTGDWFMAGFRAEANLGAKVFRFGRLPEVSLPLPQIGVSYVNRFFTNYDLARTTNPFRGVVVGLPPSELWLRIRDDSPKEGNGARIYRIRVLVDGEVRFDLSAGREPPGVLVLPTTSRFEPTEEARIVEGDAEALYRFPLLQAQEIGEVLFEVEVANDYRVELSRDGQNWSLQAVAERNVTDLSNRRTVRFFYGELTDETTFGVDLQTTLGGFSIEAERSWYSQTLQYPIFNAARKTRTASAWYLDVNRRFGPLFWRGEYTSIGTEYGAVNFVDDNDNEDPYLDAREPSVPFAGSDRDDRDRDGIKDYEDDFLLFFSDPPEFVRGAERESMDFNNNGQPDSDEDDLDPNYRLDYDQGTRGWHTFFILDVPVVNGLSVIPGYYEKQALTTSGSSRGYYGILSYEPRRIPGFGRIRMRYTVRRSWDTIPDPYVLRGRLIEDDLTLSNYIGNILTVIVQYDQVENLQITTKFKVERNNLFNLRRRDVDAQLIHQMRYDWKVRDDLTLSPAFRSDRALGYAIPASPAAARDTLRNAYILTMTHQVAEELQLSAGLQYLTWRDFLDGRNSYNRRVGFLGLVLQGKAFGQGIGLIATVDFTAQTFLQPVGGDLRATSITVELFLL
ncbi:MAG: hypothetical protein KatS3mg115_0882 [Candidatus Poribacteria bacterium]|nr:MAG: hypothetical protein KatS3mg115_0882 [Candidatus Poribacteria bacterium]